MFKALSNEHRLAIFLRLLSCCGPDACVQFESDIGPCVGELCKETGIAPSTVSHHMKELRQAGLIRMERRGRKIECCVDGEALDALRAFIAGEWEGI